jgi:hypothetical protein
MIETKSGENKGRKLLQYDPNVKGDLPDKAAQDLYDAQATAHKTAKEATGTFIAYMIASAKKGGFIGEPFVLMNYGKVAVVIDNGTGSKKTATVPGSQVDWAKASAALAATA